MGTAFIFSLSHAFCKATTVKGKAKESKSWPFFFLPFQKINSPFCPLARICLCRCVGLGFGFPSYPDLIFAVTGSMPYKPHLGERVKAATCSKTHSCRKTQKQNRKVKNIPVDVKQLARRRFCLPFQVSPRFALVQWRCGFPKPKKKKIGVVVVFLKHFYVFLSSKHYTSLENDILYYQTPISASYLTFPRLGQNNMLIIASFIV